MGGLGSFDVGCSLLPILGSSEGGDVCGASLVEIRGGTVGDGDLGLGVISIRLLDLGSQNLPQAPQGLDSNVKPRSGVGGCSKTELAPDPLGSVVEGDRCGSRGALGIGHGLTGFCLGASWETGSGTEPVRPGMGVEEWIGGSIGIRVFVNSEIPGAIVARGTRVS